MKDTRRFLRVEDHHVLFIKFTMNKITDQLFLGRHRLHERVAKFSKVKLVHCVHQVIKRDTHLRFVGT